MLCYAEPNRTGMASLAILAQHGSARFSIYSHLLLMTAVLLQNSADAKRGNGVVNMLWKAHVIDQIT